MKKYWRWILFGLLVIGLIVLWLVIGANKNLRQKVEALILEKFIKNKVHDLKEKASAARAVGDHTKEEAEAAENKAKEIEKEISKQKEVLQRGLENRGMNADEISNRFNNLSI